MAKKDLRQFDYIQVAKLDTDMWRAYYEHRFFSLFLLLLKLIRAQFGFSWPAALRAAYYAAFAATDYRLQLRNQNYGRVLRYLVKLYKFMSDHTVQPFDYNQAAATELEWWNIHRYPKKYAKKLEVSLAESAAVIYNGKPENFMPYGRYRAEAMLLRDRTGKAPDWATIESLLVKSWQALHKAVN